MGISREGIEGLLAPYGERFGIALLARTALRRVVGYRPRGFQRAAEERGIAERTAVVAQQRQTVGRGVEDEVVGMLAEKRQACAIGLLMHQGTAQGRNGKELQAPCNKDERKDNAAVHRACLYSWRKFAAEDF